MATCLLTEFFFTFRFYIKIRVTILHIPPIFYPLKVCFDHSHKKNFDYDLIQSFSINYCDKIYVFYIISNYKKGLFHAKSMVLHIFFFCRQSSKFMWKIHRHRHTYDRTWTKDSIWLLLFKRNSLVWPNRDVATLQVNWPFYNIMTTSAFNELSITKDEDLMNWELTIVLTLNTVKTSA